MESNLFGKDFVHGRIRALEKNQGADTGRSGVNVGSWLVYIPGGIGGEIGSVFGPPLSRHHPSST